MSILPVYSSGEQTSSGSTAPCCFHVKVEEHGSVEPRFRSPYALYL